MQVYLCPSPELYPLYHRPNSIVIIVDIFRASTTMVAAFAHGAKGILPVASTEEAEETGKRLGALIAAERNVVRCDFAQLGNDPAEYTTDLVSGREIVFTDDQWYASPHDSPRAWCRGDPRRGTD